MNADVAYISLVEAGANRAPFKITKAEKGPTSEETETMFNMGGMTFFKKTTVTPLVAAIVVNKGADLDAAKARIEAAGFSVEKMEEHEDAWFFAQVEETFDKESMLIMKFDDDICVMVAKVNKTFMDLNFDSASFDEVFAQEAFFPSTRLATEILASTIGNIMSKADEGSDAVSDVANAVDEFRDFITGMISDIPVDAFKLEDPEVLKAAHGKRHKKAAEDEGTGEEGTEEGASTDGDEAGSGDGSGDGSGNDEDGANAAPNGDDDAGDGDDPGNDSSKGDGEALKAALDEALSPLKKVIEDGLSTLKESLSALDTRVTEISTATKAATKKADAAARAVKGTVPGDAQDDDQITKDEATAKKAPPLLDTAINRPSDDAAKGMRG